jgi:hypothetical protein
MERDIQPEMSRSTMYMCMHIYNINVYPDRQRERERERENTFFVAERRGVK